MISSILFALLGVQIQAQGATAAQTQQILTQVQELRNGTADLQKSVDQIKALMPKDPIVVCSAEVRWQSPGALKMTDSEKPVPLSMISMVSAPSESCLNAEVRITANYYDDKGAFVCSGQVVMSQTDNVQTTVFEFRPLNLEYFAKWRDGPTWERSNFHRMGCVDYQGFENRDPGAQSSLVKLFATILPKRGGLAIAELSISLPPPPAVPAVRVGPGFR